MIVPNLPDRTPPPASRPPVTEAVLRARAQEMEAVFLAEMLGHAGLNTAPAGFGGGVGEDQFASFLRAEQAAAMAAKGGIGLAESIFQALKARTDVAG